MSVKKFRNKCIAVIMILTILLVPLYGGAVFAENINKKDKIFLKNAESKEVSAKFISKAQHSDNIKNLESQYKVDSSKIEVKQLSMSGSINEINAVIFPIKDNTGYDFSRYVVYYDKDGNYLESLLNITV